MKHKLVIFFITLLALQSSFAASSSYLCQPSNGMAGGTLFYKTFLDADKLEQPYPAFYQGVDDVLEVDKTNNCPSLTETEQMSQFISAHQQLCIETCEEKAVRFHDLIKTFYRKGAKIKELQSECRAVCHRAAEADRNALSGYLLRTEGQ